MKEFNKLIIACDGESASGKSTAAKLVAKKYKLVLINSGLLYRHSSKLIIENKPKDFISFLKKEFKKVSYKSIEKKNLHTEEISNYSAVLAKNKNVRKIINQFQMKLIKSNRYICVEGRDIASKILNKNPKYHVAFYFKCNIDTASFRRWNDLKKKVPLNEVKKSLQLRTKLDKNRKFSPLRRVKDSVLIETHKLNKLQMFNKMVKTIKKKQLKF